MYIGRRFYVYRVRLDICGRNFNDKFCGARLKTGILITERERVEGKYQQLPNYNPLNESRAGRTLKRANEKIIFFVRLISARRAATGLTLRRAAL